MLSPFNQQSSAKKSQRAIQQVAYSKSGRTTEIHSVISKTECLQSALKLRKTHESAELSLICHFTEYWLIIIGDRLIWAYVLSSVLVA